MRYLVVIPARGGSKGILHKNIKPLNGKPLIEYAIDVAREIVSDEDICVSTDDDGIIKVVENYGLKVPFKRPDYLATDTAGTYDVLLHALSFYEKSGKEYDAIILLQTTSPFRTTFHIRAALSLYTKDVDMVVSVQECEANPYYNCFEEDVKGLLHICKGNGQYVRRQDAPKTYQYNGAIYIINSDSLKRSPLSQFTKRVKYIMDDIHSIDLDTMTDWYVAEMMIQNHIIEL